MTTKITVQGFDQKKFETVVHYIIESCGNRPNFAKTVLYKLLYFVDFDFYELSGMYLTGEDYKHIDRGPAPVHFDKTIKRLVQQKKVRPESGKLGKYDQQRFTTISRPDLSLISGEEKEVIDKVIHRYGDKNATQMEGISHRDIPVEVTKKRELIDYDLVFYREQPFAMRDYTEEG